MSTIARKINLGVAAAAFAAAATFTPVSVATAAPVESAPSALAVSVGQADLCTLPFCLQEGPQNRAPGDVIRSVFQNNAWWFGPANPNPPARSNILVFTPISLIPGFLQPLYGWFTQNLNFEACVFGGSIKVGPYGTTTVAIGRGCN